MKTTIENRARGCLVGLAVGDAVGTTLEFKKRDTYTHITDMVGGGPFNLAPGEWTDDTSMALALGSSIIKKNAIDQIDILTNFSNWFNHGAFSHNNECFDIGFTTISAINKFDASEGTNPICGNTSPTMSGNGGIMRLAPVPIFAKTKEEAEQFAKDQSETTHASVECLETSAYLSGLIWEFITYGNGIVEDKWNVSPLSRSTISSSGYVIHTAQAALWALGNTDSFKDAILLAANLGDDADTVAAVTGQLAGALYGYNSIPKEWIEKLAWENYIRTMADNLLALRTSN